jgi:hypothetical protein
MQPIRSLVTMLKIGAAITHRMLVEAARGWFLSARLPRLKFK